MNDNDLEGRGERRSPLQAPTGPYRPLEIYRYQALILISEIIKLQWQFNV